MAATHKSMRKRAKQLKTTAAESFKLRSLRAKKAARTRKAITEIMKDGYTKDVAVMILAEAEKRVPRGIITPIRELVLRHEREKERQAEVLQTIRPEDERDLQRVQNNEVLYPCFRCVEAGVDPQNCDHCEHGVYIGGPCSKCEQKARAARLPKPVPPEITDITVPDEYATREEEQEAIKYDAPRSWLPSVFMKVVD